MGWSDLPSELLITIASNLTEFTDHLRFRSVCSHWHSSLHSQSLRLPQQVPWLALPSTSSTQFYSISEDRTYANPPPSLAALAENSSLFGSSSGWFLSVSLAKTFSLINPFTGATIGLPSPDPCCSLYYVAANTLVWDRSDSVVVAACSTRFGIFYCRFGEAAWASIESQQYCMASRIIFYEGRFYALQDETCNTVVLDGETLEQITVIDGPDFAGPDLLLFVEAHLFVSSGELLLLIDNLSQFYMVRGTNLNDDLGEWIDVNDIGDRALFVDNLHCFSVKVGDNSLLMRNCIYSAQSEVSDDGWTTYSISIDDLGNRSEECLEGALSKFPIVSVSGANLWPSWIRPCIE